MNGVKGFNKDLSCKGFKFKEGEEYVSDKAVLCQTGFHFVEYPIDVFNYYTPAESVYHTVVSDGVTGEKERDTKRVCTKIKIGAKLDLFNICKLSVDYILERVVKEKKNTGDSSAATNTGNSSAATNTGNGSAATNTGDSSAATNTGNRSAATVEGKESFAIVTGIQSKASGTLGCYLILAEWIETPLKWVLKTAKCFKVDGKKIKANTFYTLKNGKALEVKK